MDIKQLELPSRTENALREDGVLAVEDLLQLRPSELLRMPNFGRVGLKHVREALVRKNLSLDSWALDPVNPPNWMNELSLSGPLKELLVRSGIHYLEDLLKLSSAEIRGLYQMGPKRLGEIESALSEKGLTLLGDQVERRERIQYYERKSDEFRKKAEHYAQKATELKDA